MNISRLVLFFCTIIIGNSSSLIGAPFIVKEGSERLMYTAGVGLACGALAYLLFWPTHPKRVTTLKPLPIKRHFWKKLAIVGGVAGATVLAYWIVGKFSPERWSQAIIHESNTQSTAIIDDFKTSIEETKTNHDTKKLERLLSCCCLTETETDYYLSRPKEALKTFHPDRFKILVQRKDSYPLHALAETNPQLAERLADTILTGFLPTKAPVAHETS